MTNVSKSKSHSILILLQGFKIGIITNNLLSNFIAKESAVVVGISSSRSRVGSSVLLLFIFIKGRTLLLLLLGSYFYLFFVIYLLILFLNCSLFIDLSFISSHLPRSRFLNILEGRYLTKFFNCCCIFKRRMRLSKLDKFTLFNRGV